MKFPRTLWVSQRRALQSLQENNEAVFKSFCITYAGIAFYGTAQSVSRRLHGL